MKTLKYICILLIIPLFAFTTIHKYYVSVTKIEYVEEKKSVQIITRIFIDDFEKLLRQRYDSNITLNNDKDLSTTNNYIERYLREKIKIDINNTPANFVFLGKEYENDIVYCYLEIENVKSINNFQISNRVLLDLFEEQENVVRTQINNKYKSFILKKGNDVGVLNFN